MSGGQGWLDQQEGPSLEILAGLSEELPSVEGEGSQDLKGCYML